MKTTFRTIAAVSAAVLALVSCSKANIPGGKENTQTAKERVFTLSFNTTGTKTALNADGDKPEFQNGDKIEVFQDGGTHQTLDVTVSGGQATVTVPGSISGDFKAVYPASAWQAEAPYFQVKNIQDGTFANANICLAEVTGGATEITFNNQTVLFTFDVTSYEGSYIHVIAARDSISNTKVEGNSKINRIVVPAEDVATIKGSADKTCYVSVYVPKSTTLTCHGISFANGSKIKVPKSTAALTANNIFPVNMTEGWDYDYVEVTMAIMKWDEDEEEFVKTENTETYKWATKNLAATEDNLYGDYYMWGEVKGHKANYSAEKGNVFVEDFNNFSFTDNTRYPGSINKDSEFDWVNCPFIKVIEEEGLTITKYYNGVEDDELINCNNDGKLYLDLTDDVANVNWGGSWRMPTGDEFAALALKDPECDNFKTDFNGTGVTCWVVPYTDDKLYFPAGGYGNGVEHLACFNSYCCYWSSSLVAECPNAAWSLLVEETGPCTFDDPRYQGHSVRALSD